MKEILVKHKLLYIEDLKLIEKGDTISIVNESHYPTIKSYISAICLGSKNEIHLLMLIVILVEKRSIKPHGR